MGHGRLQTDGCSGQRRTIRIGEADHEIRLTHSGRVGVEFDEIDLYLWRLVSRCTAAGACARQKERCCQDEPEPDMEWR
jgi:hypothetical protein